MTDLLLVNGRRVELMTVRGPSPAVGSPRVSTDTGGRIMSLGYLSFLMLYCFDILHDLCNALIGIL